MTKTRGGKLKNDPPTPAGPPAGVGGAAGAVARGLTCDQALAYLISGGTRPSGVSVEDFDRHCDGCASCHHERLKVDIVELALSKRSKSPSTRRTRS